MQAALRALDTTGPDPVVNPTLPRSGSSSRSRYSIIARMGQAQAPPPLLRVGGGRLGIRGRPKLGLLVPLHRGGVTHLVTLLSGPEGARQIGAAAQAAGLAWIWVDVGNGRRPSRRSTPEYLGGLRQAETALAAGGTVVVHCAAGIHRTGMFAFALLRTVGQDHAEALQTLPRLRTVTADTVGVERLAWAEDLATLARAHHPPHR